MLSSPMEFSSGSSFTLQTCAVCIISCNFRARTCNAYLADWMEISKSNSNGIVAVLRYQSDF